MVSWADGEDPPQCAGGYDIPVAGTLSGDLVAPDAVCTCECGDASGGTCHGEMTLRRYSMFLGLCVPWNFAQNLGTIEVGEQIPLNVAALPGPSEGAQFGIQVTETDPPPSYTGGACAANSTADVPDASFASHVALCAGAPLAGRCEQDTACMPLAEPPQDDAVCIWQEGEVACPAGSEYSERTVVYQGTTDDRGCTPCECGAPSGDCSDGSVPVLGTTFAGSAEPPNWCLPLPPLANLTMTSALWAGVAPTDDIACDASGGTPQGEAAGADPITVCCYDTAPS